MAVKTTSERLFEYLGSTTRNDSDLAEIANEVDYLEVANSNLLKFVFDVNQATNDLIKRAREEMEKAYSPERFAEFEAEAEAQIQAEKTGFNLEAFLERLNSGELGNFEDIPGVDDEGGPVAVTPDDGTV